MGSKNYLMDINRYLSKANINLLVPFLIIILDNSKLVHANSLKTTVQDISKQNELAVELWATGATNSKTVYHDRLYNHQPVILKDLDDTYMIFWIGHPLLAEEGAIDQVIYASKSTDEGNTWEPRFSPFQSSKYTTNPHISINSSEWQPRAARIRIGGKLEAWVGYGNGRGS